LEKYFYDQQEYIKCKPGCSYCCETGHFPVSEIEYSYLQLGVKSLNNGVKHNLNRKVLTLYRERFTHLEQGKDIFDFSYKCPLLENALCLVYEYRPIICRTHGLITSTYIDDNKTSQKYQMPSCVEKGLNYADVWDKQMKMVSTIFAKTLQKKVLPEIYELGFSTILDDFKKINHGDIRMIFEWILLDIPDCHELIAFIKQDVISSMSK
jgi:Fe-S-cluster containining protein